MRSHQIVELIACVPSNQAHVQVHLALHLRHEHLIDKHIPDHVVLFNRDHHVYLSIRGFEEYPDTIRRFLPALPLRDLDHLLDFGKFVH